MAKTVAVRTLFNKNNITIKRYINAVDKTVDSEIFYSVHHITYNTQPSYNYTKRKPSKIIETKVKHESPLGFYYYTTNIEHSDNSNKPQYEFEDLSKTVIKILFNNIDKTGDTYELTYMRSYHGTNIGPETRPWDLSNNEFPDHYITDLLSDINLLFETAKRVKNVKTYQTPDYTVYDDRREITLSDLKFIVMKDLFGDPKGPKFQTNSEKILAHGFDLKTSFRKM